VIILGSGLAGATLGAVLAKNGFSVLILEKATFPRFAVGESMLPQCTMWIWMIAHRYGVPELLNLCTNKGLCTNISPRHGIKRSIAFTYHRTGATLNTREMHQFIGPELPMFNESHIFRQDVDHYLSRVAVSYGAISREGVDVSGVELSETGVQVGLANGETFKARYLVDGTGYRSIAATKYGLREDPTRARTQTRTLFTHVQGLRPFDDFLDPAECPPHSFRWHDGTLHHSFDGGWFWIIPFDNTRNSSSPLCSIGLSLDLRKYPLTGAKPEDEFRAIVNQFPTVARHLQGITTVRPWTSTGRLQYSSVRATGQRYMLLSHAYGFIDALYSRGMINTFESLNILCGELIRALTNDDFSGLSRMDEVNRAEFDDTDLTVSNAYRSMANFEIWNAWKKVWFAANFLGDLWMNRGVMKFLNTGNLAELAFFDSEYPRPGASAPFAGEFRGLISDTAKMLDQFERGELAPATISDEIHRRLKNSIWLPPLISWGDPEAHHMDFKPELMTRILAWARNDLPAVHREKLFDFLPPAPPPEPVGI
jgi:FADH2 O2-dependent halogenase